MTQSLPLQNDTSELKLHSSPRLAPARKTRRKPKPIPVLLIAALLIGGTLLAIPISFPSGVNTYGRITPVHQWVLVKGLDGQLVASTFNFETGLSEGYGVFNFNRGSSVNFSLLPSLVPGQAVSKGDTLGNVFSSEMQERLVALNGQLATAQQMLAVSSSGEKAAVVREAEQRLQAAKRRQQEHAKVEIRNRNLFAQNLISQGEYERVKNEASALGDEIAIAGSNLDAARTGAKPEQVKLVHANIAALESEIAAIRGRVASYTVTAPISGTLSRAFASDTLLTISDTSSYIALIPLRMQDYTRVAPIPNPTVTFWGGRQSIHGKVIGLNRELRSLHGQKVVIATALLDDSAGALIPGMFIKCRVDCPRITARQFVTQFFGSLSRPGQWYGF